MNRRKLLMPVAILIVVVLVGFTSCSSGDLKAFEGILQKIDSLSGNVTVTLSDNTTATFNLKDIDIKTIREALGDASLDIGDNVTVRQGRHGDVKELKVRNAETQGIVKSLGTDNVTITTKKGDITLIVTTETQIKGGGKDKPVFSDLKVGQRIEVKYDVSTLKALKIVINANGKVQENHDNQGNKGHKA